MMCGGSCRQCPRPGLALGLESDPMNKPLLIRADASPHIGTGHVMRCLALAQAWREVGGHSTFLSAVDAPLLEERLKADGMSVTHLGSKPGSGDDTRETVAMARQLGAKWVVADGYHFDTEFQRGIKDAGLHLLYVDDAGYAGMFLADLVLNQNVSADESLYANRPAGTQLLLGTRYALLRREFWKWRGWKRNVPDIAANVLVTLGGSDPDNLTRQILQSLLALKTPGLLVRAVIGAANPHGQSLRELVDSSPGRFELIGNTSEMPELMAWADLAVAAGGSTCWELALMGLPMVLLVLADNQRAVAAGVEREGAAINLGWNTSLAAGHMLEVLDGAIRDPAGRRAMSERGARLVDGYGASRVAAILRNKCV